MNAEPTLRVVATLTTLPDRYDLLSRTIDSLINQDYEFDVIYISLPKVSARFGTEYPPLPFNITKYSKVVPVILDTDYGPITKILGALMMESNPNTYILCVDDDIIYPPDLCSKYLTLSKSFPDSVICGGGVLYNENMLNSSVIHNNNNPTTFNGVLGFTIPPEGRNIDIIFGVGGVLYQRGFFPHADRLYSELLQYSTSNHSVFINDDVMISAYLDKKGIPRRIFANAPYIRNQDNGGPRLSSNILKMAKSMDEAVEYLGTHGFFQNALGKNNFWDSALARIILVLLLVFLLLFLIFMFFAFL